MSSGHRETLQFDLPGKELPPIPLEDASVIPEEDVLIDVTTHVMNPAVGGIHDYNPDVRIPHDANLPLNITGTDSRHIPSEEELVQVGPKRSPSLHNATLTIRIIQLVFIWFFMAGMSIWVTICVAVVLKISNPILQETQGINNSVYGVLPYFAILSLILQAWGLFRSILRTFIRIVLRIWSYQLTDYDLRHIRGYRYFFIAALTLSGITENVILFLHYLISSVSGEHLHRFQKTKEFRRRLYLQQHAGNVQNLESMVTSTDSSFTYQSSLSRISARRIDPINYPIESLDRMNATQHPPVTSSTQPGYRQTLERALTNNHEDERLYRRRIDKRAHLIIAFTACTIIGLPMLWIGGQWGFWALVSYVTMGLSLFSAAFLFLINVYTRILRWWRIVHTTNRIPEACKNPAIYFHASIVACLGYDKGRDVYFCFILMWIVLMLIFIGKQFSYEGFKLVHIVPLIVLFSIGGGFSVIYFTKPIKKWIHETYMTCYQLPFRRYYTGRQKWPAYAVSVSEVLLVIIGMLSLTFYDAQYASKDHPEAIATLYTILCLLPLSLLLRLAVFLLPFKRDMSDYGTILRSRLLIASIFSLFTVLLSIIVRSLTPGFTGMYALLIAYSSTDYRHPTYAFDKNKRNDRFDEQCAQEKKSYVTIRSIVQVGSFLGIAAFILAQLSSGNRTFPGRPDVYSIMRNQTKSNEMNSSSIQSPVCTMKIQNYTMIEFAELSLMAYDTSLTNDAWKTIASTDELLKFDLLDSVSRDLPLGVINSNEPVGISPSVSVFTRNGSSNNLTVIAVRGTASFNDALQDLYLYGTSNLLKISSYFGTLIQIWPVEYVAFLLYLIENLAGSDGRGGLSYSLRVLRLAQFFKDQGHDVVVTGHSIGASVSGIVAAKLGIPGVGFCGPGLGYQSKRYDFIPDKLLLHYVNVAPVKDVVVSADEQLGLIQQIPCYEGEPFACHSLVVTMKTIKTLCQ